LSKIIKTIGRLAAVQSLAAGLAAGLIGLVRATTRWQVVNDTAARGAWSGDRPMIVAFWHNRLAMMPYCWPSARPFHMLISSHPDGRLIARTIAHFGFKAVAGSSRRGGAEALRALVRLAKDGQSIGITPDGPRGPRMRIREGTLTLARLSGVPIVPAAVSVRRRIVLRTWDRLIIALPFSKGAMVWGDPIAVPRDADDTLLARLQDQLEQDLLRVTAEADRLAGHAPMEPADRSPGAERPPERSNARA
jgi:lysophospholipid acyltransferase (LPLAT)-like uncharacterized protein